MRVVSRVHRLVLRDKGLVYRVRAMTRGYERQVARATCRQAILDVNGPTRNVRYVVRRVKVSLYL